MRLFTGLAFTVALFTASAPDYISLTDGWVFQTDPRKTGVAENWMQAEFDDSSWKPIAVGTRWEDHGYRDYNGVGWYRIRVDVPGQLSLVVSNAKYGSCCTSPTASSFQSRTTRFECYSCITPPESLDDRAHKQLFSMPRCFRRNFRPSTAVALHSPDLS